MNYNQILLYLKSDKQAKKEKGNNQGMRTDYDKFERLF